MHNTMIDVKNLTKVYGNHTAVHDISFTAQPGEILGILGPNGAGKTTTMRILTGFMPPTGGHATIAGFDVMQDSMEIRKRVGYMPERVPIYPDMTVEGYVTFWANMRGVPGARMRVREVLDQVSLLDRRKSLVRNLSKGLKQRLGLAQALVHDPEVVILDEPTIGIDPQQVIEVRDTVRSLAQNHTVLFSTHILSEAEQVCDRVVIINKGRVVAQGRPEALRQQLYPGDHIFVQVEAANAKPEHIMHVLRGIPGVKSVEPSTGGYTLLAKRNADIRPHIAPQVAQAGYTLLEMRPVAMTLEDIFLDIVGRGEQAR
ncbi:MAG: ABC transporter ATP-binding protein [Anaerolineae bacterium]